MHSIDLLKAYDMVRKETIIKQLNEWNIDIDTARTINSFLSNRYIKVTNQNKVSNPYLLQHGIRQGSSLSCRLFKIYVTSLSIVLNSISDLTHFINADDIILVALAQVNP